MPFSVEFTSSAEEDEGAILDYLVNTLGSPGAAHTFITELESIVDSIGAKPEAFPKSSEPRLAALGYRKAPVKGYILLYKIMDDRVVVGRIFHQSQDYTKLV